MMTTLNVMSGKSVGMRNEEERPLGKDTLYIGRCFQSAQSKNEEEAPFHYPSQLSSAPRISTLNISPTKSSSIPGKYP
jgi:hypothetical protein